MRTTVGHTLPTLHKPVKAHIHAKPHTKSTPQSTPASAPTPARSAGTDGQTQSEVVYIYTHNCRSHTTNATQASQSTHAHQAAATPKAHLKAHRPSYPLPRNAQLCHNPTPATLCTGRGCIYVYARLSVTRYQRYTSQSKHTRQAAHQMHSPKHTAHPIHSPATRNSAIPQCRPHYRYTANAHQYRTHPPPRGGSGSARSWYW